MKKSGTDTPLSVIIEIERSKNELRYSAASTPRINERGTAISAADAARKKVLPMRLPIRSATSRWLVNACPISPLAKFSSHSR